MLTPVEVAVTVLGCRSDVLAAYNHRWGSFTLPMTRRKKWQDPTVDLGVREEEWSTAGARAAAEILGRTLPPKQCPKLISELKEYRQSGEDGVWKIYSFQIFALPVPPNIQLMTGVVAQWLSPADFLENQPISSTARYLISHLREKNLLPPWR